MPFQFSLAEAKQSALKNIAGSCPDSQQFLDLVNEAQRRLLRRGNWFGTEWRMRVCFTGCHITWPKFVATVLRIKFCGTNASPIYNNHYSFIGPYQCDGNRSGLDGSLGQGWCAGTRLEDANMAPCYNDITGNTGKLIRLYVVKRNDIGKKARIYGKQFGGQPLQEKDADGNWVPGLSITAAAPFGSTSILVTKIDAVILEPMQGTSRLYEYDPNTNLMRDLAAFDPGETNPRLRRHNVHNLWQGCKDSDGVTQHTAEALVKLSFQPVYDDRDLLVLDNFDALKFAVMAIKAEEAGDNATAEAQMIKAIRELNFDLRNGQPDFQTAVRVHVVDGRRIVNAF